MNKNDDELNAETLWFHVMQEMVFSEELGKMEGSTVKVYLVIKAYCHLKTGLSFPSIDLIAQKAYLSKMQVGRCLNELVKMEYLDRKKDGKHNIYTLREKVFIKDKNDIPQAIATWDYIPGLVTEAVAELRHAVITGEMVGGKIIHIENLNLHLNIAKDNAMMMVTNNQGNQDIRDLTPEMQEKLLSIKNNINKKKKPH